MFFYGAFSLSRLRASLGREGGRFIRDAVLRKVKSRGGGGGGGSGWTAADPCRRCDGCVRLRRPPSPGASHGPPAEVGRHAGAPVERVAYPRIRRRSHGQDTVLPFRPHAAPLRAVEPRCRAMAGLTRRPFSHSSHTRTAQTLA